METQQIIGLVLYCVLCPIFAISFFGIYYRGHLPVIKNRSVLLCLNHVIASFCLLTFLLVLLLVDEVYMPNQIVVFFGFLLTSLFYRPYLLRVFFLFVTLSQNQKITEATFALQKQSKKGHHHGSNLSLNMGGESDFLAKFQQRQPRRMLIGCFFLVSVLVDLVMALIVMGARPEVGFKLSYPSASSDLSIVPDLSDGNSSTSDTASTLLNLDVGYPILEDWYLFGAFLIGFLGLLCYPVFRFRNTDDVFFIKHELIFCLSTMLLFGAAYIITLYSPIRDEISFYFSRYFFLAAMVVICFVFSIIYPLIQSYRQDFFDSEKLPKFSLREGESDLVASGVNHTQLQDWSSSGTVSIPLHSILENGVTASSFQVFLSKEFSAENLFFYRMVEKYTRPNEHITPEMRLTWAKAILTRFLMPGSMTEVNVSREEMARIKRNIEEGQAPVDLFTPAQKEVYDMMQRDSLPRFLKEYSVKSGQHQEFVNPTTGSNISSVVIISTS